MELWVAKIGTRYMFRDSTRYALKLEMDLFLFFFFLLLQQPTLEKARLNNSNDAL